MSSQSEHNEMMELVQQMKDEGRLVMVTIGDEDMPERPRPVRPGPRPARLPSQAECDVWSRSVCALYDALRARHGEPDAPSTPKAWVAWVHDTPGVLDDYRAAARVLTLDSELLSTADDFVKRSMTGKLDTARKVRAWMKRAMDRAIECRRSVLATVDFSG